MVNLYIDGKTKLYGLFGDPIHHSFSPFIHNYLAQKFSVNAAYLPFNINFSHTDNQTRISELFSAIKFFNVAGANVTAPYKELVAAAIQNQSQNSIIFPDKYSSLIRSVNTIKFSHGSFFLFNTDVFGLLKSLLFLNIFPKNKNVLLFGAGGAARAALFAIASLNPSSIFIANRNFSHALNLASYFSPLFPSVNFFPLLLPPPNSSPIPSFPNIYNLHTPIYLAVNTTPLGSLDSLLLSPSYSTPFFSNLSCAFDFIYNPPSTTFLNLAKKFHCFAFNGFSLLFFQAALSFQIWHNLSIPDEVLSSSLLYLSKVLYHES